MNDTPLGRFFGVVTRPRTWLSLLFHILAFPLGLFYFVFLVTGLSVGLGLVVIWVGIPILLVVAGAWWLFGAFERIQARVLLGADRPERRAPGRPSTASGARSRRTSATAPPGRTSCTCSPSSRSASCRSRSW